MFCFSKCCRLCLTKNNTLANIKCSGLDRISFLDKLGLLAPSLIVNPRNYMLWICEQCRSKLKKAYSFIQHCIKSDAILDEYCKQLKNAHTSQIKYIDSNVSDIQFAEHMIKESIPISVKEGYLENLPAMDDDQYYSESTLTFHEHELPPADFEINLEYLELKQETGFNIDDASISNNELIVSECNRDQAENVQIDPFAGISENYISYGSDDDSKDRTDNCNMNSSNSLPKHRSTKKRKLAKKRRFECNICNKKFTRRDILNQHNKIHLGESYECKICKKKFTQISSLNVHGLIHTGERCFKCKMCNKKFIQSNQLKAHERVHTGERPYECKMCGMKFKESGTLKRHEIAHTGEKRFKCKICNKTLSGHLKRHEKLHKR